MKNWKKKFVQFARVPNIWTPSWPCWLVPATIDSVRLASTGSFYTAVLLVPFAERLCERETLSVPLFRIWSWKRKLESEKLYQKRNNNINNNNNNTNNIDNYRFYKRLEDFDSLQEFNDYLEEFEDIVFNLVNDVDVQSTSARLESFKTDNRDTLERNLARLANEQRQAQLDETAERIKREKAKAAADSELEKEKIEILQAKQQFINDLVI